MEVTELNLILTAVTLLVLCMTGLVFPYWGKIRYGLIWVWDKVAILVPVWGVRARLERLARRGVLKKQVIKGKEIGEKGTMVIYRSNVDEYESVIEFAVWGVALIHAAWIPVNAPNRGSSMVSCNHGKHRPGGLLNCRRAELLDFVRGAEAVIRFPRTSEDKWLLG